ncbi:hypothetical protein ACFXJO_01835 [Streptomyces lavendulae]|uniref:hypothetical protein n=1 Tax=Streptomyces lavendulae TaxID=1914 RepID=UPI0036C1769B
MSRATRSSVLRCTSALLSAGLAATALTAATAAPAQAASSKGEKITRSEVIARAQYWVDQGVPYNQSGYYTDGHGTNYREDCSGFVSMAWHADQSYNTWTLPGISSEVSKSSLLPGDALNYTEAHVILFGGWKDKAAGTFTYYAEQNSNVLTNKYTANINSSSVAGWPTSLYKGLRYDNIVDDTRPANAGVYRASNQTFYERNSSGGTQGSAMFGNPGWKPLIGDFNGDGTDTIGVYDPANGDFHLSNDNGTAAISVRFGNPNWTPLVGDWNGDGKDTVGAYDPTTQKFYLSNDNSTVAASFVYGNPGDVPLAGDWDGDGKDSVAVYRPDNATFYEADLAGHTIGNAMFGNPGWTPLIGDWNGDGIDTIGVYEPATQKFSLSNDNGTVATSFTYGNPGDTPISGAW